MSSITAINQGISAIQAGMSGLRADASAIASATQQGSAASTQDLTRPLINLKQDELQVAAGAKVIEAADKTLGSLLDVKA